MAGRKETPRQKMIGMMYLVLTALLALQVSSALIYKFQALNTSLEKTVLSTDVGNRNKLALIGDLIKKHGEKPKEVKLFQNAKIVHLKTQSMLREIDQLKKELIDKSGGYNEDGSFKGANEETEIEVIMLGANENSGKAYQLKKKLDEYVSFMNGYSKTKFESLARNASEDPTLENNSDQRNKDYAHLNFGQTPMVAALAVLSETEARIVNMENSVLVTISENLGLDIYTVDRLTPVVKPQSDYVVAGTKYQAEMFMVASSTSLKPQMQFGTSNLQVNKDGIGSLNFVASGGNYNANGTMKKTWTGKIKIKTPEGNDTIYNIEHEYTVVKPVIQVQSASIQSLYRNCGNKMNITVPALGPEFNPVFKAEGASIIRGDRAGVITLVPTLAKVKLDVTNNGNFLGQEIFGVKLIPLPSIDVKVSNRKVLPTTGISIAEARSVSIKVVPERGFAEALPQDSRYTISEGKIILARGSRQIKDIPVTGQNISLASIANEMRPGDRLIIEVRKVKRINFRNETEEVAIPIYYETIALN
jgi:gliding motility-associated protein GldM